MIYKPGKNRKRGGTLTQKCPQTPQKGDFFSPWSGRSKSTLRMEYGAVGLALQLPFTYSAQNCLLEPLMPFKAYFLTHCWDGVSYLLQRAQGKSVAIML